MLVIMGMWFMVVGGCASSSSWYRPAEGASPTGGLGIQLELRDTETNQFARYRVEPDGAFTYWGGKDVLFDSITWQSVIDDDQGRELARIVREQGLMQSPAGGPEGTEPTWELQLVDGTAARNYTVYGQNDSLESLYDALQRISSTRFAEILDALPQPSVETLVAPTTDSGETSDQP